MGSKLPKREREVDQSEKVDEAPAKRRRESNSDKVKLSKLYADLATEEDDVRLEAAKQIIVKFSPENKPEPKDVEDALVRLIKGLCSQRKAARVGFSLTLTELLRQLFAVKQDAIEGSQLDVAAVIKMVEEKTKAKGNVPGKEKRDHTIGKLFGFKAIMQSSILIEPELSLDAWNKLLDNVYRMARDIPWLREECGMVLVEAVRSLKGQSQYQKCVEEILERLNTFKLVSTPEGVAVWLTVQASYPATLPASVWHDKDPLARKERSRLAKILKEDFNKNDSEDGEEKAIKTGTTNSNPSFTWDLVFAEILRRDEQSKSSSKDKTEFPQFWIDTVDSSLFSSSASHERKAWGFKLLSSMITRVPEWAVSALFSPNLMRTLINQSKKEDRFLHSAALAALSSVQLRVEQEDGTALPIFVALTSKHGSVEFDRITRTKTLEQILASADDKSLMKIIRYHKSLILRPESEEQAVADSRRQAIADLLLNTIRQYKRYEKFNEKTFKKDIAHLREGGAAEDRKSNWLREILETLVEFAYFIPSKKADTKKMPLPPVSDRSRTMFQERLSSCLTKLLDVKLGARSDVAFMVLDMIRARNGKSAKLDLAFKADESVLSTMDKALSTIDAISATGSIAGNEMAAQGFLLLYSLTLLQAYNGEGDAVMMLDDLDASYKAFEASRKASSKKKSKASTSDGQNAFVEIVLSFSGNERTLFRRIGEEAFSIFASEISAEGLRSLTEILDTEENLEGQKELFNQGDEDAEEEGPSDDDEDDSDVEMVDGEEPDSDDASESGSDDDDSDASEEEDAELTQFDNMLAMTLQTSKPTIDGEAAEETSDESDMDDDQMMALDPHLSKIFKERSKTTSKKKERTDAKQNVVQFKSRVLDLLAVYMEKQYSNALTLDILLPVLRRTRANANKQTADKAAKMLKSFFDTRTKRKAPLPKPENVEDVWELLKGIHEEAKLGNGSKVHADACGSASLHVVKVLVGLDKGNYAGVVDVYAETQKQWFADKKSPLQPVLFTQFQNWSVNARQQGK
ncbi:hypothetical protein J4E81_006176 [Alternaria sp. BMP 2799]|nr:hypothetical protein J4E81_006176 [Alternaria sp. BMP 2799]